MKKFIQGLPKVELHCHIEGTLEPELMFELAQRNGIALPYSDVTELRQSYAFNRLQDFLDIYYQGMNVLQTEQDFFDLTWAYLNRIHSQNVRHTEIFFDPQAHLCRGLSFDVVINGINRALGKAGQDYGISSRVIMCFLRHLDQTDAFNTLELARPYREKIIGVGLDSSERDNPPEKFEQVFAEARKQGYRCVAHAGEEGAPEYIYGALDRLQVERIDHGNSCLQEPVLVERLIAEKMPLTMCPLSNTRLYVVPDMSEHPLKRMLDKGMCVTVNSDDPAYFGGYMNENFVAVADALNLSRNDLMQLSSNAIEAAFIQPARKHELKSQLASYVGNKH